MATKVKVAVKGKDAHIVHCAINAGTEGNMGSGTHEFSVGNHNGVMHYLTITRVASGEVKILAETGNVKIEVDSPKGKILKKGKISSLSSKFKRVQVWEV